MTQSESRELIEITSRHLKISQLLDCAYVNELIRQSEGHPYVIKILLGEVAKEGRAGNIPRLVANRDEILTALFERTYESLGPCAQRAFMTLASWNSTVPRIVLEAVLHRSIDDRKDVERSIELLLLYSLAERQESIEGPDFLGLPLVANVFGRRKLNVSPLQTAIKADVEVLQMFGATNRGEAKASLKQRMEYFLASLSRRTDASGSIEKYKPIIDMVCRNFPPAHLTLARWYMEQETTRGYENAVVELNHYLEQDPQSQTAAEAWRKLADCCFKLGDKWGNIHAFIQRCKISSVPFIDLANTAEKLNELFSTANIRVGADERRIIAQELLDVMHPRKTEARASHLARMAGLALALKKTDRARDYVNRGLELEPTNKKLIRLRSIIK